MGTTAEKLQAILNSKADIGAAITEKGGTVPTKLSEYGDTIRNLKGAAITGTQQVEVVAKDQIAIGDVVYTISGEFDPFISADEGGGSLNYQVQCAAFSPDGSLLVLGGAFTGMAKLYSVSGNTITYLSDIYADAQNLPLSRLVTCAAFSPDGSLLVLGFQYDAPCSRLYAVSGATVNFIGSIAGTENSGVISTAAFSPDGSLLVLGGQFSGYAKVYSVNGTTITYLSNIYADTGTTALSSTVSTAAFSPDGSLLVLGGAFTGRAKVYKVNGASVQFFTNLYQNKNSSSLSGTVYTAAFSLDGSLLVLGGAFTGRAKLYSVRKETVAGATVLLGFDYLSDIYADTGTTALSSTVSTAAFSPDGSLLVLGGAFTGNAKVYAVGRSAVTYLNDISFEFDSSDGATCFSFSPDGSTLIMGGYFHGNGVVLHVDKNVLAYSGDIPLGFEANTINYGVYAAAFSPDGSLLVLAGEFSGGYEARLYSVDGTTLTFLSGIDAGIGSMNVVFTAAFSPDGYRLVLGGNIPGKAMVYSVSGTTVTFKKTIYADAGTTALDGPVSAAAFVGPAGNLLVLGGDFTGKAKVYLMDGTNAIYMGDIYADKNNTPLDGAVRTAVISPGNTHLVLGGAFSGKAKLYSVKTSTATVTYIQDIRADEYENGTALNKDIFTAVFSPDGALLVLGGMDGICKLYSITTSSGVENMAAADWLCDIPAGPGTTALSGTVHTAAFSPDGSLLVLGGAFTGMANVYAVGWATVTYICTLRDGDNPLLRPVKIAAFAKDSSFLVLGGTFYGKAKQFLRNKTPLKIAPSGKDKAYPVGSNGLDVENGRFMHFSPIGIGYADDAIASGEEGTVQIICKINE